LLRDGLQGLQKLLIDSGLFLCHSLGLSASLNYVVVFLTIRDVNSFVSGLFHRRG
jgi:hypothetical protein